MRTNSRFISGEDISAAARWDFANVDAAALLLEQRRQEREAQEQMEAYAQQVRTEAYAEGVKQGRAQLQRETQEQMTAFMAQQGREASEQFASLVTATQQGLDAAEQMAAQAVLELACDLARQVLRREVETQPDILLPVIRESIGMLFADARVVQIRLHPQDLEVLQAELREAYPNLTLQLQPDPSLTRGGCLVESGGTIIDGRLEKRWARAVARLGQSQALEEAQDDPR
jgi:flagellar assembly protein FliH